MILTPRNKITGQKWSEWAGVSPRIAQKWLQGTIVAPAWAVNLAVNAMGDTEMTRATVALALLSLLAERYAEQGAGGDDVRLALLEQSP